MEEWEVESIEGGHSCGQRNFIGGTVAIKLEDKQFSQLNIVQLYGI